MESKMTSTKEGSLAMCYTNETLESSCSEDEEFEALEAAHQRRKSTFVHILRESMNNVLFRGNSSSNLNNNKKKQSLPFHLTTGEDNVSEALLSTTTTTTAVEEYNQVHNMETATLDSGILLDVQWFTNQIDDKSTDEEDYLNLNVQSLSMDPVRRDISTSCSPHTVIMNSSSNSSLHNSSTQSVAVTSPMSPNLSKTFSNDDDSNDDDDDVITSSSFNTDIKSDDGVSKDGEIVVEDTEELSSSHYNNNFTYDDKVWIEQNFFGAAEFSTTEGNDYSFFRSFDNSSNTLGTAAEFPSRQQEQQPSSSSSPSNPCLIPSAPNDSLQSTHPSLFPPQIFFPSIHFEKTKLISCSSINSSQFDSLNSEKSSSVSSEDSLEGCITSTATPQTSVPTFVSTHDHRENSSEVTVDHEDDNNIMETAEVEPTMEERPVLVLSPSSHDTRAAVTDSPRRKLLSRMYSDKKKRIMEEETTNFLKSCQESKLARTFLLMKRQNEQSYPESNGDWPSTAATPDGTTLQREEEIDNEPWQALFE